MGIMNNKDLESKAAKKLKKLEQARYNYIAENSKLLGYEYILISDTGSHKEYELCKKK